VWSVCAPSGLLFCSVLVALSLLAGCRSVEDMQRDYAKKITPRGLLKVCRQDRRRLAVFKVTPAQEVAYVQAMRAAQTEVERRG
jgi:hypothetical protein